MTNFGPVVPFSEQLHAVKYRGRGESFKEMTNRIASALADNDAHFGQFRDILRHMRFLPGGRIQAAIGSTKHVTAFNCFVSGTLADAFTNEEGCIMQRAAEAATTMRMGGGIGYDFSTLRPRGALIKKLDSTSSGPISFMEIFNAICLCTSSAGNRRGAQMGVLRCDHPDIEEFIHAKQNEHNLRGFNLSVAITDEFMLAVKSDSDFDLRFGGETYRTIRARALWEEIMRSTWDWAEPGVLFIDRINKDNNLWYAEAIAATNPCGEQPLSPHAACLLGSFNLVKYVKPDRSFDYDQLSADLPPVVRAMDNVTDVSSYPLPEQKAEALSKRRMGLGVAGAANAIEAMGYAYGSPEFIQTLDKILQTICIGAYTASVSLAREKGAFPKYDRDLYGQSAFVKKLPDWLQEAISKYGIRNSHLTSIAPTGTISLCADNISSAIEPVVRLKFPRQVNLPEGQVVEVVEDYGYRVFGTQSKTCDHVTPDKHIAVLIAAQRWVDSAVSKTCNVPATTPWEDFKNIYMKAWEGGAKGCTTFTSGGKRQGIFLETESAPEGQTCRIDPTTGRRECD